MMNMSVYEAEAMRKQQQEQLEAVTRLAWRWGGKRDFCLPCLIREWKKEIQID